METHAPHVTYIWNRDFTQAEVTWRHRSIAVLFVPKFADVPNMKRTAYLFNRSGDFRRFADEPTARAYILDSIERAEGHRAAKRRAACPAA